MSEWRKGAFQIVDAAIWNEQISKDMLLRGICELAEECDRKLRQGDKE